MNSNAITTMKKKTRTKTIAELCCWALLVAALLGMMACGGKSSGSNQSTDSTSQADTNQLGTDSGDPADSGVDSSNADSDEPGDDALTKDSIGEDTTTADTTPTFDLGEPVTPVVGGNTHTLVVEGQTRQFIVYLSEKAKNTGNAPVVLMFHGSGQNGQLFYEESHWRETSDREGLIAVFPTALIHCYSEDDNKNGIFFEQGERRVGTKWSHGKLGDPTQMPLCGESVLAQLTPENRALADHPLADDIAFVKAMLAFLDANYSIDAKRVYATGFSNGAAFVGRLTAEMSHSFAATHSQAGFIGVTVSALDRPMGRIFSVGEKDDRFTEPAGVAAFPLQESLLKDFPFFAVKEVSPDLTMLRLTQDYIYDEKMVGTKKVIRYTFSTSEAGWSNQYMFVVIGGLFHQYPNGTNHPLVIADYLWEFFKQYSL